MFHAGSPAYSDPRMTDFLDKLPYFRKQLTNPKNHVTRQLLIITRSEARIIEKKGYEIRVVPIEEF
jgi:hypothetical protein